MIEIRPCAAPDPDALYALYDAVGWTNYIERFDRLLAGLQNSLCVLGAFEEDRLVGLIRAVGDGETIVFVQDLLVLPLYQRRGIGSRLLRAVLDRFQSVYQFELLTDDAPSSAAFYRACGLTPADELGCRAFVRM